MTFRLSVLVFFLGSMCPSFLQAEEPGLFEIETSNVDKPRYLRADSTYLPLSAKAATTWCIIQEVTIRPLPDQTSLGELIKALKNSANTKNSGINIYIDPESLVAAELSMASPVRNPFVGNNAIPLYSYMEAVFEQYGFRCIVNDNIVIIKMSCCDCPPSRVVTLAQARTWVLLQEEVSLKFPKDTTLGNFLSAVHLAIINKQGKTDGLLINVDQAGLREEEKTLESPIVVDFDHVTICVALGIALKQQQLIFYVRQDGVLVVTAASRALNTLIVADETGVADQLVTLLYSLWHQKKTDGQQKSKKNATPVDAGR